MLESCRRPWAVTRDPMPATVPVIVLVRSVIALVAAVPTGSRTSLAAGLNPRIQRLFCRTVRSGLSVTRRPPRSTVRVTGAPSLVRMRFEICPNLDVVLPFTATISSPICSPAASAGFPEMTPATVAVGRFVGAPLTL